MKKLTILFIAFLAFTVTQAQQERGGKKAQIEALKVKYFTEELDLSEEESEKFWPIYYQYENQKKKIKKNIKQLKAELTAEEKLTSDKLNQTLSSIEKKENEISKKHKEFIQKSIPILGLEKCAKLLTIEDKLRKNLATRVKSKMEKN